jgi:hypothetical protein
MENVHEPSAFFRSTAAAGMAAASAHTPAAIEASGYNFLWK